MNKIIALVFAFFCFATALLSNSIMGAGVWFWVIVIIGMLVPITQYSIKFQALGVILAILLSVLSLCVVLLGLLAATIGGSFRLSDNTAQLLFLFSMITVSGIILQISSKRGHKKPNTKEKNATKIEKS